MAYTPLVLYSIKDEKKAQQITALCKSWVFIQRKYRQRMQMKSRCSGGD